MWIANIHGTTEQLVLVDLVTATNLPGQDAPFGRLASLLANTEFEAAAIDAPFSVPASYLPGGGHRELLDLVASLAPGNARPFASAVDFVAAVTGHRTMLNPAKPLRETEEYWRRRGVNVRSTLWTKARGGAAMTAACLTLLHQTGRPLWPWSQFGGGLLVEAFPAAQLRQWHWAYQGYNGPTAKAMAVRASIVSHLRTKVQLGKFERVLRENADATDAVLCAFGALAVRAGLIRAPVGNHEGWIAVHP